MGLSDRLVADVKIGKQDRQDLENCLFLVTRRLNGAGAELNIHLA